MSTWEPFRLTLERLHGKSCKSSTGHRPIDAIVMFKLLVLLQLYDISGEELEYRGSDRLSLIQFWGSGLADDLSNVIAVVLFHPRLVRQGLIEVLVEQSDGAKVWQSLYRAECSCHSLQLMNRCRKRLVGALIRRKELCSSLLNNRWPQHQTRQLAVLQDSKRGCEAPSDACSRLKVNRLRRENQRLSQQLEQVKLLIRFHKSFSDRDHHTEKLQVWQL